MYSNDSLLYMQNSYNKMHEKKLFLFNFLFFSMIFEYILEINILNNFFLHITNNRFNF